MYLLAFSFDFDRNLINFYKLYNQETVDQTYISLDVNSISDIPNLPIFTIDPDVVTHNKFFNGDEDNSVKKRSDGRFLCTKKTINLFTLLMRQNCLYRGAFLLG